MTNRAPVIAFTSGGIGDQLYHFSQIQALSGWYKCKIDLACRYPDIIRKLCFNSGWAGKIIDIDPLRHVSSPSRYMKAVRQLAMNGYERAFVFHRSTNFKLAAKLAGISHIAGYSGAAIDRFLIDDLLAAQEGGPRRRVWGHRPFIAAMDSYLDEHRIDYIGPAPLKPYPSHVAELQSRFNHLPRPWIISNLFTQDPNRRWPVGAACQRLSEVIRAHGGSLFISSGADARSWYHTFSSQWPTDLQPPVMLSDLGIDIEYMPSLYHLADLYIGIDSFTANLAMNCDLPALILFGKDADSLAYRSHVVKLVPNQGKKLDSFSQHVFAEKVEAVLRHKPPYARYKVTG